MKLEYVGTDIEELSVKKFLPEDAEISLQANSSFTVYISDERDSCIGEFSVTIFSQFDPEQLTINYSSKSFFNMYDVPGGPETEQEIHEELFNRIFPMCNETIKQFASMVGLPNISLVEMDMASIGKTQGLN